VEWALESADRSAGVSLHPGAVIPARRWPSVEVFFVAALLLFSPLVSTFILLLPELSSPLNYVAVGLAFLLILRREMLRHPNQASILVIILITVYIGNYALTYYGSWKWLLNTLGFLVIFYAIIDVVARSEDDQLAGFGRLIGHGMFAICVLLLSVFLWAYVIDFNGIAQDFVSGNANENTARLTVLFGVEKQGLGNLIDIFILWFIVRRRRMSLAVWVLFSTTLLLGLPFWMSVRTTILCLVCLLFWYLLFVRTVALKWVLITCLALLLPFLITHGSDIYELIEEQYDRLPSLLFAIDVVQHDYFGLGNGGYFNYVLRENDRLLAQFSQNPGVAEFWLAPEADIVYFIACFGVLSIVIFYLLGCLVILGARVYRRFHLPHPERWMLLSSAAFVFSGISQDNATNLTWWLFMAAGAGVIFRYRDRRNLAIAVIPMR
jgi:hypothetical protein